MWFSGKLKGYKKSILTIKKKQYKKKTFLCLNLKKATETKNCGVIKKKQNKKKLNMGQTYKRDREYVPTY